MRTARDITAGSYAVAQSGAAGSAVAIDHGGNGRIPKQIVATVQGANAYNATCDAPDGRRVMIRTRHIQDTVETINYVVHWIAVF